MHPLNSTTNSKVGIHFSLYSLICFSGSYLIFFSNLHFVLWSMTCIPFLCFPFSFWFYHSSLAYCGFQCMFDVGFFCVLPWFCFIGSRNLFSYFFSFIFPFVSSTLCPPLIYGLFFSQFFFQHSCHAYLAFHSTLQFFFPGYPPRRHCFFLTGFVPIMFRLISCAHH